MRGTLEERFWAKVDMSGTCWLWLAARTKKRHVNSYGVFSVNNRARLAHRVSYEISNGAIPEGLFVDHMCHNKHCVRPEHLRLATKKQNQENLAGPLKNNTSGFLGVSWSKHAQKWDARVAHNGKQHFIGNFTRLEDAAWAVRAKRIELFTHNVLDRSVSS